MEQNLASRPAFSTLFGCRRLLLVAVALAALAGCASSAYLIPKQQTAKEQYEFAVIQEREYRSPFRAKSKGDDFERALAAYDKVIKAFPDDNYYNPRAHLAITMLYDSNGAKRKALSMYEKLLKDYPGYDNIQVDSLYGAAVIYDDTLRKYEKAQDYYNEILKRYSKRTEPYIRNVVNQTQLRAQRIRKK